jgi:hypothetical protein
MGYFSNGTEGMMYESEYCENCRNYIERDNSGVKSCPIMDAHMHANYDQFSKSKYSKSLKEVLETLIPTDGIYNDTCSMFTPIESVEVKRSYFRDVLMTGKPTLGQWAYELEV